MFFGVAEIAAEFSSWNRLSCSCTRWKGIAQCITCEIWSYKNLEQWCTFGSGKHLCSMPTTAQLCSQCEVLPGSAGEKSAHTLQSNDDSAFGENQNITVNDTIAKYFLAIETEAWKTCRAIGAIRVITCELLMCLRLSTLLHSALVNRRWAMYGMLSKSRTISWSIHNLSLISCFFNLFKFDLKLEAVCTFLRAYSSTWWIYICTSWNVSAFGVHSYIGVSRMRCLLSALMMMCRFFSLFQSLEF